MKALILGAYGFLGIHLCSYLESKGFCVIRSGRSDTAFIKYFHRSGSTNLLPILQDVRPDIIINLIALTNVDQCEKDPRQAYDMNTDLPAHLKSSIAQLGITPWLFIFPLIKFIMVKDRIMSSQILSQSTYTNK